jgi:hypothetical protein
MAGLLDKLTSTFEAYNPIFQDLSRPVANVFGIKNLGPHFDVFAYSFILFNLANIVLVPGFSRLFFNRIYGALDAKVRNKWYVTFPFPPPHRIRKLSERAHVSVSRGYTYPPHPGLASLNSGN